MIKRAKALTSLLLSVFSFFICSSQDLNYFLPDSIQYDPSVPKPKEIIYHEVGEWHITHDRLVNYMKAIATAVPARVRLETMGYTYEGRPQVLLIITSPANHRRLEEIRQQHVSLTDPGRSASLDINRMPVVVWIGHSIHGNESSGANASLISAYYLAAAQGKNMDELLENSIILFDPSFNPDGLQRFSTWANQHKSRNLVSDPNSREFNEVWPGGRFNHYWFDLNRDWLPAIHIETQNRLAWFHKWKPNILTDHHEQSSNSTFFFQPGVPSRVNPLTPEKNQELTTKLAKYHAAYLDRIGSLYYTKENYDDFYYGKGSTYPDIQGCIGILFEQASSRGHLLQTVNGLLSFPFTIRNQFVTTLSTLEGAKNLRKDLLEYQRDFFKQAGNRANAYPVKGYVFGDKNDRKKTILFAEMLKRQQINIYDLPDNWKNTGSYNFTKGNAWYVPLDQAQHTLVRTLFEKNSSFKDTLFYDITSWTMPLAYGIPYQEINTTVNPGDRVETFDGLVKGIARADYAYLVKWSDLLAPAAAYELLKAGLVVKVANQPFSINLAGIVQEFDRGTLLIPVRSQLKTPEEIYSLVNRLTVVNSLSAFSLSSGNVQTGIDLGSNKFAALTLPVIAMITGTGVNATDAGEVWHLLDQRMSIPVSHLEPAIFNRVELTKYNTIIMVGGSYTDINKEKLKTWVQNGGVLVLTEEAVSWAAQNGISDVKLKKLRSPVDSLTRMSYTEREQVDGAQQMNGAIFGSEIDLKHPLAYGYQQSTLSLFKANKGYLEKSKNPYATPFYYGNQPLQSGWVSRENLDAIRQSAAVVVSISGSGKLISIADNPNFRAFWLGGTRLFMNAIFFGRIIDPASARTE
jgi:hypothetical protein